MSAAEQVGHETSGSWMRGLAGALHKLSATIESRDRRVNSEPPGPPEGDSDPIGVEVPVRRTLDDDWGDGSG